MDDASLLQLQSTDRANDPESVMKWRASPACTVTGDMVEAAHAMPSGSLLLRALFVIQPLNGAPLNGGPDAAVAQGGNIGVFADVTKDSEVVRIIHTK